MKKLLLSLVCLLIAGMTAGAAGNFSYLYIQGDKQTPFYVKLEDAMQPRFGKNYCIISKLAPGPAHIEILFQQNVFPPQRFTVQVPEGGSRGFLLVKSDAGFSLYDLQQDFYLHAGNNETDDRQPAASGTPVVAAANPTVAANNTPDPGTVRNAGPAVKPASKKKVQSKPIFSLPKSEPQIQLNKPDGNPDFIGDLELTRGGQRDPLVTKGSPGNQVVEVPAVINTDCPAAMSSADFSKVFSTMSAYATDEDRLEYINGQMSLCYASWQARTLAGRLEGDAARYELLRKIYPRIADQAAFPLLDDLLKTEIWKAEFSRLIRH